jgi:superfamily II DNA helicase RecQ
MSGMFKGGAYTLCTQLPALGTAGSIAVVVPMAGRILRVDAVSDAAQTSGISTVTVVTEADAAIASLAFAADQAAFAEVSDTVLTNATVTAGQVLKVATNGTGDGAGELFVVITIVV